MAVKLLVNGIKVAKGTKYSWDKKISNDIQKTFDGTDIGEDESPYFDVKISRIISYDPNFESNFENALASNTPIVVSDTVNGHTFTDTYTGCVLDSIGDDKAPNKKATEDLAWIATGRTRVWS